jgi:hypothetical protein
MTLTPADRRKIAEVVKSLKAVDKPTVGEDAAICSVMSAAQTLNEIINGLLFRSL